MESNVVALVRLRNVESNDLPRLYEFNLEPDANRMAATIPRSADAFAARWENRFSNPIDVAKAILVGDELAGNISCFQHDGANHIGYWLGRGFWGKGIASRALELLLKEIQSRPLYARVASTNPASLRVLQKNGFLVQSVRPSPADDRFLACDEALLILK